MLGADEMDMDGRALLAALVLVDEDVAVLGVTDAEVEKWHCISRERAESTVTERDALLTQAKEVNRCRWLIFFRWLFRACFLLPFPCSRAWRRTR